MKYISGPVLIFSILCSSLYSNIIEVPADQSTIQEAINIVSENDTILVAEGIYQENINFNGKNIVLTSHYILDGDGRFVTETILDGNREGSVVVFENGEDSTAQLIGFSIINGSGTDYCPDAVGCGVYGGGIFCVNSSPVLKNLIIRDNETNISGGGLFLENSNAVIINCTISDNYANTGDSDSYGIYAMGANITLINTIVFPDDMRADSDSRAYYSLINNSPWYDSDWIGGEMITGSPQFINPDSNNYHLSNISPGIDGGDPLFSYLIEPNYDGRRINIGVYGNTSEATISNPEIDLTEDPLFFQSDSSFKSDTSVFVIYNTGSTRLNIISIEVGSGPFTVNHDSTTYLMPSDSLHFEIIFGPTEPDTFYSHIDINTNDEDEPSKRILLSGSSIYFSESPQILSIEDIPNDQGGWVTIDFIRSIYDTDSLVLPKIASAELYTVELDDGSGWAAAVSNVAYGRDIYSILVPTTLDSTSESDGLIEFRVIAGMDEGNYSSYVLSGYSIDNLHPAVPTGLSAIIASEHFVEIAWNPNQETDFKYYRILRREDGTEFNGVHTTIDTIYTDDTIGIDQTLYYAVQAVDHSGNYSGLSNPVNITITGYIGDVSIPTRFDLSQNFPNPFNPKTIINYELPITNNVELSIYNLLGQKVASLVNKNKNAGYHQVEWDASRFSSGVYYYMIKAGEFQDVKKMILIK